MPYSITLSEPFYSLDDVLVESIETREEQIESDRKRHVQFSCAGEFDPSRVGYRPDIQVCMSLGGSEAATVHFDLNDTGNDEDGVKSYDCDISIENGDAVGPRFMLLALAMCIDKFYAMGLNTKFGALTGEWSESVSA